ncbi:MAG: DUF554 domain-containing protein [Elusimicrobia bacterium]|nr:DUF554 domain-containing protein [Elusimicrobiota bacterium]
MTGTLVNAAAILIGGGAGLLARRQFSPRFQSILLQAVGLCVLIMGLQMALKAGNFLVLLAAMTLGGLIGELCDVEGRLERFGARLQAWVPQKDKGNFAAGFITTSLWFCVGPMAIIGSVEDGLKGNSSILLAKAALDGISSLAAAASLGSGVLLSAVSVLLYQGTLTLCAGRLGAWMTPVVVDGLSAAGGLLIFAIGLNVLGLAKIRLGNFLPALLIAAVLARC